MRKQPTSVGQFVGGIGLSLLSAAMLIASWPSLGNLWWLIGIAFVPMYIAQYRLLAAHRSFLLESPSQWTKSVSMERWL